MIKEHEVHHLYLLIWETSCEVAEVSESHNEWQESPGLKGSVDQRVNVSLWAQKECEGFKCWIMISKNPPVPTTPDWKQTLTLARAAFSCWRKWQRRVTAMRDVCRPCSGWLQTFLGEAQLWGPVLKKTVLAEAQVIHHSHTHPGRIGHAHVHQSLQSDPCDHLSWTSPVVAPPSAAPGSEPLWVGSNVVSEGV